MPKVDECPAEMATVMKRFQGTPAGEVISNTPRFLMFGLMAGLYENMMSVI